MAGTEVKDVLLRLRGDASGFVNATKQAKTSLTDLNQGAELGIKAAQLLSASFKALLDTIDRGQKVTELSTAFESLSGGSGRAADALSKLREATGGTINDLDLMRASNEALLAGLSPDAFLQVADAADKLGKVVGQSGKEALEQMTVALASGNDKLLKRYGITVDNKKAEENYAKTIGLSADKLNEAGKREAARIAILEEMGRKTLTVAEASETAQDVVEQMAVAFQNSADWASRFANESPAVIESLKFIKQFAMEAAEGLRLMFSDALDAQATRLKSRIKSLKEEMNAGGFLGVAGAFLNETLGEGQEEELARLEKALSEVNDQIIAAKNNGDKSAGSIQKQTESAEELRKKFTQVGKEVKVYAESIGDLVDPLSFAKLNVTGFSDAFATLGTFYGKEVGEAAQKYFEDTGDMAKEAAKKLQEDQKEAFKNSVGFFEDILTTTITGSSQSLEEILTDALKRVAIGFGAQLLAEVAASMGLTSTIGNLGSASGLGGGLASGLSGLFKDFFSSSVGATGSGGIFSDISSLSSAATSLDGAAVSLNSASGSLAAVSAAALPIIAGVVGVGTIGYGVRETFQAIEAGDRKKAGVNAGVTSLYSPSPDPVSATYNAILSYVAADGFGGNPQLAAERKSRNKALRDIQERMGGSLSFQGVNGPLSLNAGNFNIDTSGLGGDAVGLSNPLAQILTGGDDKLGSDLAAIFANATKEGSNFNEVLVNTQSLMDSLGINAEDAKVELTSLFLDGKISLDEFGASLHDLNLLAQEDLIGPNSIADAFNILADNIDKNPRVALKGLGLVFKELSDNGITSTDQILAYISEKYPELLPVFQQLMDAGIDTFEEIKNANADTVLAIFNTLGPAADKFKEVFGGAAEQTDEIGDNATDSAAKVEKASDRMVKALTAVENKAYEANEALRQVGT